MSYQNHKDWITYLYDCYSNKTIPINSGELNNNNDNKQIAVNEEIEDFEEIVYRSVFFDFKQEWLNSFPPLLCRQKGFYNKSILTDDETYHFN